LSAVPPVGYDSKCIAHVASASYNIQQYCEQKGLILVGECEEVC